MSARSRCCALLQGWGTVGLGYSLGALAPGPSHWLPQGSLERALGCHPAAVWCYATLVLLVPLAYWQVPALRLRWLRNACMLAGAFSAVIYWCWPTALARPLPAARGVSGAALAWLAAWDTERNCLPSLHGALLVLCLWALWRPRPATARARHWRHAALLGYGALMCLAILAAQRHGVLDLAAGLALGGLCGVLAGGAGRARSAP